MITFKMIGAMLCTIYKLVASSHVPDVIYFSLYDFYYKREVK